MDRPIGDNRISLKRCASCKAIAYPDDLHCACCGSPLLSAITLLIPEGRSCNKCGTVNRHPTAFYCSRCGARLTVERKNG